MKRGELLTKRYATDSEGTPVEFPGNTVEVRTLKDKEKDEFMPGIKKTTLSNEDQLFPMLIRHR